MSVQEQGVKSGVVNVQADACEVDSPDIDTSIRAFCDARGMSLHSRLDVMVEVCTLVSQAHAMGVGFARIGDDTVTLQYVHGELAINIANPVPLRDVPQTEPLPGAPAASRRFSSADMVRVLNLIELGRLLEVVLSAYAEQKPVIQALIKRATSLNPNQRPATVQHLRDQVLELKKAVEIGTSATPRIDSPEVPETDQRWWSWA